MDSARCRCAPETVNVGCPIHGISGPDPIKPYRLSENDRTLLSSFRISTVDPDDLAQVRQADEDRWKERR